MKAYSLDDTAVLCAHLMRTRTLYAPCAAVTDEAEAGDAHWLKLAQPVALSSPPLRPMFSPKQFFFAERETLFVFDGRRFVETVPTCPAQVLFGLVACDLSAIAYQDQFFAADPHYQQRRAATLLVGIDCRVPCAGAFCHVMDTGPTVRVGTADLVLHPEMSSGRCILIAQTAAGEAALVGLLLEPAPSAWDARRRIGEAQAREACEDAAHIMAGAARLNAGDVSAETWEQIGLACVSCTGCTTVCPTCSCFTTRDERIPATQPSSMSRVRLWDSCLLDSFQREASGHNPSASAGQRVERFWYHKFSDDFRGEFGRVGCVGCGRCDTVCPSVIGAHSVMRRLAAS